MTILQSGQEIEHKEYGTIELVEFRSIGDELEIFDTGSNLDPVLTVQDDKVEFVDKDGSTHVEPLDTFYEKALIE